jgi:hypothetical protein
MHTKNSVARYYDGIAGDVRPAAVVRISKFIIGSFGRTWDQIQRKI